MPIAFSQAILSSPLNNSLQIINGPLQATAFQTSNGVLSSPSFIASTHRDRQIIVQNPDFEGSSVLPPPGWVQVHNNETLSYETVSQAPNKKQSIKIQTVDLLGGIGPNEAWSVVPGDTYTIQVMAKADGTSIPTLEFSYFNSSGTNFTGSSVSTTSTSWTLLTLSSTVPATAESVQIGFQNGTATPSTMWFDQLVVQKTNFPVVVTNGGGTAVLNAFPQIVAKADATAQAANIGVTTLYAVPSTGGGMYRMSGYAVVTQAATVSSTLPNVAALWTDNDTSTAVGGINFTLSSTSNSVGSTNSASITSAQNAGSIIFNAKASTNIQYQTQNYASSGATPMQFAAHIKLEYLGG